MNLYSKTAIGAAVMALASVASAQKAGDNVLSLGVAVITQDINLGTLTSNGGVASSVLTNGLKGATASTSGATTVSLGWMHMFTDNIATDVTLGIPPRLKVNLSTPNGPANTFQSASHDDAADADILAPAIVGKYLFNSPSDKFRPYVGLGVAYISFQNISVNGGSLNAPQDVSHLAGSGAKLDDSWAPVYKIGMIYNIDDHWSINGSVSYVPIETKLTMTGSSSAVYGTTTGTVKLNTTDAAVSIGYRF